MTWRDWAILGLGCYFGLMLGALLFLGKWLKRRRIEDSCPVRKLQDDPVDPRD